MPAFPKIGTLNQRAELQQPANSGVWQEVATLWVKIRDLRGREIVEGEGLVQRKQVEVSLRWREDIRADMRFVADGRILNIVSVLEDGGKKRFLLCLCEEEPDRA